MSSGAASGHPKGNYWFADRLSEDEPGYDPRWPWAVFIQLPGMTDRLSALFPEQGAAEAYIRFDIIGAGADYQDRKVLAGKVVASAREITASSSDSTSSRG
jgi:hypothetical protein